MKITLRRAAKIRNRLTERLGEVRYKLASEDNVSVNIFDVNIYQQIVDRSIAFEDLLARYMAISSTLFSIRSLIDAANAESGIHPLLAEQAQLQGQLSLLKRIADTTETVPSVDSVDARVSGARQRNVAATRIHSDELSFSCVTSAIRTSVINIMQTIQERLDVIQEQLESLNANRTIEITQGELALLQSERLI